MGLSGPRKRTKISHDPNNTAWSRSETTFGKKILQSHGWTPGSLLGAQDAPHAHLHTAANASHVRVALKDDTLGLGAKRGSGQADGECTGLDVFQGLLGRLNGKSDGQLQREERSRDDLRRTIYMESRWGQMRFVKAGLLVGDKVYGLDDGTLDDSKRSSREDSEHVKDDGGDETSKKKGKSKRRKVAGTGAGSQPEGLAEKKRKKRKREDATPVHQPLEKGPQIDAEDVPESKEARRKRRQERRERKEAKRLRKEQQSTKAETDSHLLSPEGEGEGLSSNDAPSPKPITETRSTPQAVPSSPFKGGRHAVRQRYIAQKKMAVADPTAMNEIFMIKA